MSHSKRLLKHIALAVVFFFSFQIIAIPQAYAHCPSHSGQDGGESKTPSTPEGPSDESGEPGENPTEGGDDIVYLGKGEFVHSHQDLHIPAREISIDITRTYRSQKAFISRFGYGWSINHNIKLKKLENGNVIFFDETGKKIEYIPLTDIPISWGGIVTHISSDGSSYINIISHEDGTVTLKKKDGTRYHFNALGALSSIEGKNGNKITFTYDSAGPLPIYAKSLYFVLQTEGIVAYDHKLLKIADDAGRQIDFSYDQKGMLTSITDCAGRLINYSYDENGNLLTATDPQENTTIYTYDAGNNLVSITDPKGHTYLTNTYDQNDRVISQTYYGGNFTFAYDMENHVTTETNPRGIVTRHEMNEYGNPIRITRDVGGLNLTTVKTYDDSMNLVSQTDPLGNTTNYTYDFLDNLTSVTNAEGDITRFTYLFGTDRVTSITDFTAHRN
jgi:YD repeat-containing protein